MIPTSRNVSTFFFDTFPYTLREYALSKAGYYNENMLRAIPRQMCLLEERCPLRVPDFGTMWWPLVETDPGSKMVSEQHEGQGGKGRTDHLQYNYRHWHASLGREGGQIPGLIFLGLLNPKALFPAWWQGLMGARVEGCRFWGKRITVPPWESYWPRPPNHPAWATEELGKSWVSGALRMDMLRCRLEKQGLELPGKRCRVTHIQRDASIAISVIIKGNCYIPSD